MPNLDGTGPQGEGPLTGRRRGQCRDKETNKLKSELPENKEYVYGSGLGRRQRIGGRGRGRGSRNLGMGRGYGRR